MLLPVLTNELVCVVKEMKTLTLTYKLGVTNLNFTVGLTENTDHTGRKKNDWFLPRTLRVKDKAVENSAEAEFVDFIFVKDASVEKYTALSFAAPGQVPPPAIRGLLSQTLIEQLYGERKIKETIK